MHPITLTQIHRRLTVDSCGVEHHGLVHVSFFIDQLGFILKDSSRFKCVTLRRVLLTFRICVENVFV